MPTFFFIFILLLSFKYLTYSCITEIYRTLELNFLNNVKLICLCAINLDKT